MKLLKTSVSMKSLLTPEKNETHRELFLLKNTGSKQPFYESHNTLW